MRRRETAGLIPEDGSFPQFRVWTLGILRIEVLLHPEQGIYRQLPLSQLGGKYGRLLLTSLLCSDERRILRADIFDRILLASSEGEEEMEANPSNGKEYEKQATSRLKGAIHSLARLFLREGKAEKLFVIEDEIDCYRLAGQEQIWVDADACLHLLAQAHEAVRTAHDPLPLVKEAADYFATGLFLANEEGWWVAARRTTLEERQEHCMQWLIDLYEQRQQWWEAEEYLMRLLEHDPSDEAAFGRLMDLLIKQGKSAEAFVYARALRQRLREEEVEISETTKALMKQVLRVYKERIGALTQQEQIRRRWQLASLDVTSSSTTILSENGPHPLDRELNVPLSSEDSVLMLPHAFAGCSPLEIASMDWPTWFGMKQAQFITAIDHSREHLLSVDPLQALLDQEIRMIHLMQPQEEDEAYILSRRQSFVTLAMLPMALCSFFQQGFPSASLIEKFLARCTASITICWHFLKGSELATVEQILSTYLPTLVMLVRQRSRYQQTAAKLASQAYRLSGIVALHRNHLKAREYCCQQALYYSHIAENPSLIASALISLASTFYYHHNPVKAAATYQQALSYQNDIAPLQRSRIYAELAVSFAQQEQEQKALHFLGLAHDLYPEYPENDPSFLYAEFSPSSLVLEQGLTYLALARAFPNRQYQHQAWQTLLTIETLQEQSTVPERILFEIANHQAATAILLHDADLFRAYWEKGVRGAKRLKSKQRQQEALMNLQQAKQLWGDLSALSDMDTLFHEATF